MKCDDTIEREEEREREREEAFWVLIGILAYIERAIPVMER